MKKKVESKKTKSKKVEAEPQFPPLGANKAYKRVVQIIVELNEKIVDGEDDENDPLWGELAERRKELTAEHNEVIGRLIYSLFVGDKTIEIDEATPGSHAHWQ